MLTVRGVVVRALDASCLPPAVDLLPVELLGKVIKVRREALAADLDGCTAVAAPRNAKASCEDLCMDVVEGSAPDAASPARVKGAELAPVGGVDCTGGSQLDGGQLVC